MFCIFALIEFQKLNHLIPNKDYQQNNRSFGILEFSEDLN